MALELIPVIDLMQGHVVHARLGQRTQYRPLQSPLAGGSSEALRVVDGLLALHPFNRLYIADLDAITGHGDHAATIAAIAQAHPDVELWLDGGLDALPAADATSTITVLGSESLRTLPYTKADADAQTDVSPRRWVLSLDFRGDQLLGPPGLLQHTTSWPRDIIAMTLDRVGSAQGPDLQRLSALKARAPTRRIYAAGGVRDARDLIALAQSGAHGVLLASALHDGRLSADDLRRHAPRA
ncbi:MAG: HisA/HisF-related TIM barrel protein [Thiomonas sp.]